MLEVPCFLGDVDLAASEVIERALAPDGGYACLANVHVLVSAQRDPALRSALDDAWLVLPDGAPIAWLQRRSTGVGSRVAGPDLMPRVIDRGRELGLRHFLFGSTPQVLDMLRRRLLELYPGAAIVGTFSPPFPADDAGIGAIRAASPHVVWCGLGAPRQELWMQRHSAGLAPAVLLGVGAAFDFLAGTKTRAPQWAQRAGLEWLHRAMMEPRRLAWRYLSTNALFLLSAVSHVVRGSRLR